LKDRIDLLARAVDRLSEKHGLRVAFLPLGGPSDAEVSTMVIRKCRTPAVLLPEASLGRAARIIGRAKVLVGMRLHALILAARQGVPFLAVPYDPKITAFCADLAYPLPPLLSLEAPETKPDPAAIDAAIDELWSRRESVRDYLLAAREPLERLALRNFEVLDELIAQGSSRE
jgi:polysaccharide pyruvyl transferase WcaK-like protein